ncbi:8-oxo-dGTP diphosphatase MutT [Thiofilum flexile]|uniref:8-oxo-dGTP diphosphatase MutT n=1 Tax=Thiofilum flexile TaxID=125627 RepID=UPI0003676942|nr:8-oxo-dGTP diphosphatase MutT [Thiofilum flexile]
MPNTAANLPIIHVVAAIIVSNDSRQVLLAKRPMHKHQGGKWEFPGGKVEPHELPTEALARELAEELGIQANPNTLQLFHKIEYCYPEKQVHLEFWWVHDFHGTPQGLEDQEVQWFTWSTLSSLTFPEANLPIVQRLVALNS